MKKKFILIAVFGLLLGACSEDVIKNNSVDDFVFDENADVLEVVDTEKHLVEFAKVLSKAVHERKEVREFLKNEALKQFDRNYNVLYYLVSDELIGGESFRDILISYSSDEVVGEIEKKCSVIEYTNT
jgi:hypothetical protein